MTTEPTKAKKYQAKVLTLAEKVEAARYELWVFLREKRSRFVLASSIVSTCNSFGVDAVRLALAILEKDPEVTK